MWMPSDQDDSLSPVVVQLRSMCITPRQTKELAEAQIAAQAIFRDSR